MVKEFFSSLASIVIPIYNGLSYLKRAIDSVLNQTCKNIGIILINDASFDNIGDILSHTKKYSFIKLPCNGINIEAYFSRHAGIKKATGDYIAFLNSGGFWEANKPEVQLNCMLKNNLNTSYTSCADGNITRNIKTNFLDISKIISSCDITTSIY